MSLGSQRGGFTLVEVAISVTIFVLVSTSIVQFTQSTSQAYQSATEGAQESARGQRTLSRIRGKLKGVARGAINPQPQAPTWTQSIEFQRIVGYQALEPIWGPLERLSLQPEPTDPNDGVDNDRDGLIDECQLIWTENVGEPNQRSIKLADDVSEFWGTEVENGLDDNGNGLIDEAGVCFTFVGNRIIVRMTLDRMDPGQNLRKANYETTISLQPID